MVANYVTGRRVKVRTEELINACEMETLSRGTPPWIFSHIHSPSFVLQESRGGGGFKNNWKRSDRGERGGGGGGGGNAHGYSGAFEHRAAVGVSLW